MLKIAAGTRSDLSIAKDDLFCRSPAQRTYHAGKDLLTGDESGVVPWDEPGESSSLASGDEGHFLDRIVARG